MNSKIWAFLNGKGCCAKKVCATSTSVKSLFYAGLQLNYNLAIMGLSLYIKYNNINLQSLIAKSSSNNYRADKSYRSATSNHSSTSSGLCVITTAACQALNAEDDCEELQLLRWFRDTHLQDTAESEAIVREYYRVGALITRGIDNTHDANKTYRYLWDKYIVPSCNAIRAEQWETARSIYVQMVKQLCEEFSVDSRPQIHKALKVWRVEGTETVSE